MFVEIKRCSVLCALLAHTVFAQYRVESWTADNGLPISSVNRVMQTRDGYLWMATFAGLVRYDGARFQVFNTITSKGLRTSRFVSLFEDRQGDIWAPTEGQGLTRYHNGVFNTYTTSDGLPVNTPGGIFYDTEGHLLVDSEKGLVEWQHGRFVASHPDMPSEDNRKGLFLGRTSWGATWYSDATGLHRFEHDRVSVNIPLLLDFKRAYEDRTGRLWLEYGHPDGSRTLAYYKDGKLTSYSQRDGVPAFRTFSFLEDRQGVLWLGLMAGGGLLRIQDGKVTRYTTADGLPSNNVNGPYEDREGTLWVATEGGISWFTRQAIETFSPSNGLAAENTYPILQDHTGTIWIGSWPGLTSYDKGVFTDRAKEYGLTNKNVMSLLEDRDDALWIGTWGEGVKRMKKGRLETFIEPGTVLRAMLQDRSGDIWFAGPAGLARYHGGAFAALTSREGFPAVHAFSLFQDRAGDLWIGTDAGVSRYRDGRFTNYGEKEGFPGKVVRSFYEDREGTLWLGTYDTGLFRYANGRFTRYTTQEGLLDNGAFQIMEDNRGNFWFSCNVGIYRVSRKDLEDVAAGRLRTVTSVAYGKRDGMLSAECNGGAQPSGIHARDGRMWFPTQKGVAVIDPDRITSNGQPPPVVIEEVLVDQRPVNTAGGIEIHPGQSNLEIHYAGLTFLRSDLARFQHKLAQLDSDWVAAGNRHTAYYSHLPFGTYEFQVIAANRDGIWNRQGARLTVRVTPPFWRTWWFDIAVALGLVAIATLAFRGRLRGLRREQAVQKAFSRRLIESQETERKRIAAELHDSLSQTLSIIKNRAVLSLQDPNQERMLDQMEEIVAAAGDALAEIREIVHDLRPVEIDRLGLTKAIGAMAKKVAGASGVRIQTDLNTLDGIFSSDTEVNLFRMVQEGLSNIVKHSDAADASIQVRREPQMVEITMRDNGKGFETAAASAIHVSGLGLMSISERARIIGAKVQVSSAPGHGTTLTIRIGLDGSRNGH